MRVLLCLHHRLDPNLGAPMVTLSLGAALTRLGCLVEYFAFPQAFGEISHERVDHQVRFPWHLAAFLALRAPDFDVVDASTGDAWVWASGLRPDAQRTALVTRAHGLEHVAVEQERSRARAVGPALSWRYPLYHGGWRLLEVQRSLQMADHCVMLNHRDRDYARDRLEVPEERLSVIPNAIAECFHAVSPPAAVDGPFRLAFVGRWTTQKGKHVLVDVVSDLARRGIAFELLVLGSCAQEQVVLNDFPDPVRRCVSVVPSFENAELPRLLEGSELFVFPSLSEGASASLLEAMACGLAPVATAVGTAPEVLVNGAGSLVAIGDDQAMVDAIEHLTRDRDALLELRQCAQRKAREFRWRDVARSTLQVYELARAARAGIPAPEPALRAGHFASTRSEFVQPGPCAAAHLAANDRRPAQE